MRVGWLSCWRGTLSGTDFIRQQPKGSLEVIAPGGLARRPLATAETVGRLSNEVGEIRE